MADDKGGGGSGWTAFEIILIIVLAIALVTKLQNGKSLFSISTSDTQATTEGSTKTEITAQQCGLILTKPKPLEKISGSAGSVVIAGDVEGCDWNAEPAVALYAQLIDSKGKPISPYTTVQPQEYSDAMATFSVNIPFAKTNPGTGYLILVPATQKTQKSVAARIPIQFTK